MFPVDGPFPWGLPGLRWMLMSVFPGASAVRVLLLGGGCDGMIGAGGVSLLFQNRVSYIWGWLLFLLGEVGRLGFAPFETESAPK